MQLLGKGNWGCWSTDHDVQTLVYKPYLLYTKSVTAIPWRYLFSFPANPFRHQSLSGLPFVFYHCSHGTALAPLPHCSLCLCTPALLFHMTYCASCCHIPCLTP